MVKTTDILVIGGGMAGAIAAITTADSGLRTIVVRPGYGATAISSGVVNMVGTAEWLQGVQGVEKSYKPLIQEVAFYFKKLMAESGNRYVGDPQESMLLINQLGTTKPAQLCPETMAAGDLRNLNHASVLFVGISGLNDFDAAYVGKSVNFISESKLTGIRLKTGWVEIDFPKVKHDSNLSPFDLARLLDDGQVVNEIAERIRAKADLEQYTHIALPPIMGIEDPVMTLTGLQNQLARPCFEVVAIPPSVPGYRLQKALDRLMLQYGVEIIHGRVQAFSSSDGYILDLQAIDKLTSYDFQPKVVILASGKFISGGIQWVGYLEEPVFNLPVGIASTIDIPAYMGALLSDQFVGDQRMFSAGLSVDVNMHPVATDGQVVYKNLIAAGSVLNGYNYTQGEGGLGIPMATGFVCARIGTQQIVGKGAGV